MYNLPPEHGTKLVFVGNDTESVERRQFDYLANRFPGSVWHMPEMSLFERAARSYAQDTGLATETHGSHGRIFQDDPIVDDERLTSILSGARYLIVAYDSRVPVKRNTLATAFRGIAKDRVREAVWRARLMNVPVMWMIDEVK